MSLTDQGCQLSVDCALTVSSKFLWSIVKRISSISMPLMRKYAIAHVQMSGNLLGLECL